MTWAVDCPHGVSKSELASALTKAQVHGGREGATFEVIFVSDKELAELHGRFLDDPSATDVMAFDLGEDDDPQGEIYVSVDCAVRVSRERGVSVQRELALYVIHGCLHLCGYDDHEESERARMREAEAQLLGELGYPDDAAPHELGSR